MKSVFQELEELKADALNAEFGSRQAKNVVIRVIELMNELLEKSVPTAVDKYVVGMNKKHAPGTEPLSIHGGVSGRFSASHPNEGNTPKTRKATKSEDLR